MTRIIIDAGHGGTSRVGNSSAFGGHSASGVYEKDVTLDIARIVVGRLGGAAALTRSGDNNLSLGARAGAAARGGAEVFVSIHANSGPPEAAGAETWVHPDASPGSRELASGVQRALDRLGGRYGGSAEIRTGQMAVLSPGAVGRRTDACLVEVDYLTNPRAAARLGDPRQRAAIGAAIADAIRTHIDGRFGKAPYAQAAEIINPDIPYNATSLDQANRLWTDWLARYAQWRTGVPNECLFNFPHSAICQLKLYSAGSSSPGYGTGFYIGPNKLLTCGHNFKSHGTVTTRVLVQPGYSPNQSTLPTREFRGLDARSLVHPSWWASEDPKFDLAVLNVPGLPAYNNQFFSLANRSLGPDEGIVVCGYGKHGDPPADRWEAEMDAQGQSMDGARISELAGDNEIVLYPIQSIGGHSGSPVFHRGMVVGVHTGPWDDTRNRGVLLTPTKEDWINGQ